MKIKREGKFFIIINGFDTVKENLTFEEAREFLAKNGNEDAKKELHKHSKLLKDEKVLELEFQEQYKLRLK